MKKIILLASVLALFSGCQNSEKLDTESGHAAVLQQEPVAETLSDYEKAQMTLDELLLQGERLKKGEISQERHDALTYPLGQQFRKLRASLSQKEREDLKEYSDKRYDEVYPEEERIVVKN